MTETVTAPSATRRPGRRGPPLPAPIVAYAVLTVAVVIIFPGPGPTADAGTALAVVRGAPVQTAVWSLDLLGGESDGLSDAVLVRCHEVVSIPSPQPWSVNVAVAGSIVVADRYRAHRDRLRRTGRDAG